MGERSLWVRGVLSEICLESSVVSGISIYDYLDVRVLFEDSFYLLRDHGFLPISVSLRTFSIFPASSLSTVTSLASSIQTLIS